MPSDKKRVNLTVPDEVYEELQEFKTLNGITNDASACLQLIVKQLKAEKEKMVFMKLFKEIPIDKLQMISAEGLTAMKEAAEKQEPLIK